MEPEQTQLLSFTSLAALSYTTVSPLSDEVQAAIIAVVDRSEGVHRADRSLGLDLGQMVICQRESLKNNQ